MNVKWTLLSVLLSSAMLLTACNTDDKKPEAEGNQTEQQPADQGNSGNTEDTNAETTEPVENGTQEEPIMRKDDASLTYQLNGEEKKETAYLTESNEQNYSLYKLDGYELTGEEPNKDALYSVNDDSVFMRIETISKDEADYEIILNNMTETMKAVALDQQPANITDKSKLPTGDGIENAVGYEVPKEIGTISGYVFERGNLIVRLTIFDRNSANLTDAFLKMGETVAAK